MMSSMYIPASFGENRPAQLQALIAAHPLGMLVCAGSGGLIASPLPFLLYPDEGPQGTLRAHMARANPHWREFVQGGECLVLFQGRQGYVTPNWYPGKAATHRAVPTWNYAVVQVRGQARSVEDAAWLQRQLADLTASQEGRRATPWSLADAPPDYLVAQMQAIVGIEIAIAAIEGKSKLSQNRDAADRAGVVKGLRAADDAHRNPALAEAVENAAPATALDK